MYRTVINLEFFKIPSMSGFRNRNIIEIREADSISRKPDVNEKKSSLLKKKKRKGAPGKKGKYEKENMIAKREDKEIGV